MEAITKEEQLKKNTLNAILPFRTTTTINFDNAIDTGIAAEKVDADTSISLKTPTGTAKTKFDAMDERTLSGTNWDKVSVKAALGK